MGLVKLTYRFLLTNTLTLLYSSLALVVLSIAYVKNIFTNPGIQKLKLEPPSCLTDPKYGVHKYIKANNVKLHYVESGDPSKPLMIFLHGFPEFWYSWRHQIVEFQMDYWCIAVDMRGYGDSERPESLSQYKLDILVEDIRDLVRQLGREKCILVAHDWGGLVACKFRDVHPKVLSAVILLASLSIESFREAIFGDTRQMMQSWYVFLFRMPALPEQLMQLENLRIFDEMMVPSDKESVTSQDIECYKYWFGKQFAFTPPVNYYRANFGYLTPKKHLSENVPMLVAHAANDLYIRPVVLEKMKKEYDHIETTVVEGCRHFLQQEEPQKVNKLIKEFLTKHNL